MESVLEIIKSHFGQFLLQVVVPLIIAIGACFAVYAGYKNLVNQIRTDEDLANKAEEINRAFTGIEEQKQNLENQMQELNQQVQITADLKQEYSKQKKFNDLLNTIQILSLGARNGSKKDFQEFMKLKHMDFDDQKLNNIWSKEYDGLTRLWKSEVEKNNNNLLILASTGERRKWSPEYLYRTLKTNWHKSYGPFDIETFSACLNEIANRDFKFFVETLYQITTEGNNIPTSILAAKTLGRLTDFAPYGGNYKSLIYDLPEFEKLKEWWRKDGSKIEEYTCNLEEILKIDHRSNHHWYGLKDEQEINDRKELLMKMTHTYPSLFLCKAELAYLLLGDSSTFVEVQELANEAIMGTNMEPLPYLLLAYIGLSENNQEMIFTNLRLAERASGTRDFAATILINKKLNPLEEKAIELGVLERLDGDSQR